MLLSLEKNRNKRSINKDFYQNLEFQNISKEIPISDLTKIINTYQVFEEERNLCKKYRLTASINTIATNVLANPITQIYDSLNNEIIGSARDILIATINSGYTYNCGYDIFDNHNLRVNSFKTGATLNSYTGTTITDVTPIQEAINNNLFEDNGWFHFINYAKLNENRMFVNKLPCEKIDIFPTRDYFGFKPMVVSGKTENNWDYTLTYPYENKTDHILVTDSNDINGIPIVEGLTGITNDNLNYLQISTPYKHGLNKGDIITFKYLNSPTGKTYQVYDIGNINSSNKEHIFLLDINRYSDLKNNTFLTAILNKRIVKLINKIESNYYLRKFRKIPNFKFETEEITDENINEKINDNNVEISSDNYQLGFSKNIFGDKIHQIQYIDDIDINLLKDNLNRPISEIYLTIIKNGFESNNHNRIFGEITSGFDELPGVTGYTNVRILNSNNISETPLENNITINGGTYGNNIFIGDIVEYNKSTVKETTLDYVKHRFNTIQRESSDNIFQYNILNNNYTFELTGSTLTPRNEGYYYNPHHKILLKNYSSVINQGELLSITPCNAEPFISGMTKDNIVLLNTFTGATSDLKYLLLKIDNSDTFINFDRIRISKLDQQSITTGSTTLNIRINHSVDKNILIPYDEAFFGVINEINLNRYKFQKYFSDIIPSYGDDSGNGKILWRNILPEGYFDEESKFSRELQFTNGRLYINKEINLYIRRQDPFGEYGLKSRTFPSDTPGDKNEEVLINNRFNKPNDIC